MKISKLQYALVMVQFGGIFIFVFTGTVFPRTPIVLLLESLALLLGFWAIYVMKLHTLSVFPAVKQGGTLCKAGPYRVIRHPMYTAVLFVLGALLLNQYSAFRLLVFGIVWVDLIIKMNVEEKILLTHYPDYIHYMKNTKRIIPFIY
ncbi:MAG: hypothetical protein AUK44_03640 [Porphyromonadaceae bacterium CG2_30_38_12]|nr:MAG: hypothetical protein AUK44_03640 [Porphyromonadaceae bacterium CG2_30_38_12]